MQVRLYTNSILSWFYLVIFLYFWGVCIFLSLHNIFAEHQYSSPVYQGDWKNLWSTVARIGETIAGCSDLWRNSDRDVAKKRALFELLKLLESSGLQKHKFENIEVIYFCLSILLCMFLLVMLCLLIIYIL